MPEGQEDDGLNGEKFEHWFVRPEQVAGGKVEEEERVQSQAHREVVDDCDVQVSSIHTAQKIILLQLQTSTIRLHFQFMD